MAFSECMNFFILMLALLVKNWIFDFFVSVPSTSSTDLSTISFENIPNCATSTHAASTSTSGEHFFIFYLGPRWDLVECITKDDLDMKTKIKAKDMIGPFFDIFSFERMFNTYFLRLQKYWCLVQLRGN